MKTYVLQCMTGQEEKAKSFLERSIPELFFDEQQIGRLWVPRKPIYQFREDTDGKKKLLLFSNVLLPGYILIDAVSTDAIKILFRQTPDAFTHAHLVEVGMLNEVTPEELDWINHLSAEKPSEAIQDENKRLHFTSGSLIGADDKIIKFDKRNRRALVEVDIFGRKLRAWIAVDLKG